MQTTHPTKDEYLEYIKNPQNSTVKKKIPLENGQKTCTNISTKRTYRWQMNLKPFDIISHQENANENHSEISLDAYHKMPQTNTPTARGNQTSVLTSAYVCSPGLSPPYVHSQTLPPFGYYTHKATSKIYLTQQKANLGRLSLILKDKIWWHLITI